MGFFFRKTIFFVILILPGFVKAIADKIKTFTFKLGYPMVTGNNEKPTPAGLKPGRKVLPTLNKGRKVSPGGAEAQ